MTTTLQSMMLTVEACRAALRTVIDPEIFQNIIDLGLVYNIEVGTDNGVIVTMTLTTPHCPMGPQIIENVETVLKTKGASTVTVHIVWSPPWTPYAMTEDLQRQLGILPPGEPEEPEVEWTPPPPPELPKKKGFFRRLLGY
jgi:metal-sulfur cluster biosynthetic enzyme